MSSKQRYSAFATALRALLDESRLFTRAEWGVCLNVTGPAISQWVTDKTLPRAETLRGLVMLVEESPASPRSVLEQFWQMAALPINEVTPLGSRLPERTIGHFVVRPLYQGFLRVFQPLSPVEQTQIILAAGNMARDFTHAWVTRGHTNKPVGPLATYPRSELNQIDYVAWLEKFTASRTP